MKLNVKSFEVKERDTACNFGSIASQPIAQLMQILGLTRIVIGRRDTIPCSHFFIESKKFMDGVPQELSDLSESLLNELCSLMLSFNLMDISIEINEKEMHAIKSSWDSFVVKGARLSLNTPPDVTPNMEAVEIHI